MDVKREILAELDSRLERLKDYSKHHHVDDKNPYNELVQVQSKIIGSVLTKEIQDIRSYVNQL